MTGAFNELNGRLRLGLVCLLAALLSAGAATAQSSAAASPIDDWLRWADEQIQRIIDLEDRDRTFENTVAAVDDVRARLAFETHMIQFMPFVSPRAEERQAGLAAQQASSAWAIGLSNNEDLYRAIRAYADTKPQLGGERARLLERYLRDFERQGMALPPEKRERLKEVQLELSNLSIEFDKNIRDDETKVLLNVDELSGVPESVIAHLDRIGDLCLVTLDIPTYLSIMDHCDNEKTRRKMWVSRRLIGGRKNVQILDQILKLRAEMTHLLGFENLAAYKMDVRMARSPQVVHDFYDRLRPLVREKALIDQAQFRRAKQLHLGHDDVEIHPWDYGFYMNRIRREQYAVDDDLVREYFPLDNVVNGVFDITSTLFQVKYEDVTYKAGTPTRPLWHEDVRLYEVRDKRSGELLGELYFDPHPRDNKYGHAAQWSLFPRKVWPDGTVSTPLAAMVCNFPKPTPEKPSLLRHDDVRTYFHEFGHALHTLLTEAEFAEFSGTRTELDFVELPSQMLENWVWYEDVLATFARHYETDEPIPDDLVAGMLDARQLASGMDAEFQIFLGLLDLTYHTHPTGDLDTTQVYLDIFDEVLVWDAVPHTYYQASFGHLTGYEAGYYGYLWSLVYSCALFEKFQQYGLLDPRVGMEFREKILAPGGTRDGMDMMLDFLGHEPDMRAFLLHLGLSEAE